MNVTTKKITLLLAAFVFVATGAFSSAADAGDKLPTVVKVEKTDDGKWALLRNGSPFFAKGACIPRDFAPLEKLVEAGANTLRTYHLWQIEAVDAEGKNLLDRAHERGLAAVVGIWIPQKRHGFRFDDPAQCKTLREEVRAAVRKYKSHPALLIWGLGNEVEIATPGDDPAMWNELNELARIVKEEDANHPVMTVLSGAKPVVLDAIVRHYPELDILGINTYESAPMLPKNLRERGWEKPYILAEFGPKGWWAAGKTDWNAPLEPTSEAKAALYGKSVASVSADTGRCLGNFAFAWGFKQETTVTWFSLFLPSGERMPAVDALTFVWTGKAPANRCPEIVNWDVPFAAKRVAPEAVFDLTLTAKDPENEKIAVTWWVTKDHLKRPVGGDREATPPEIPGCVLPANAAQTRFTAPAEPGAYRLYVKAVDPHGGASVRNTPFLVEKK